MPVDSAALCAGRSEMLAVALADPEPGDGAASRGCVHAPPPLVSIIIPHLAHPGLDQCLSSIFACGAQCAFEVILVANSPPERICELALWRDRVRLIELPPRQGFGRPCNAGAGIARGRYLVFLNDDTTVTEGWLDRLVAFLRSDRRIGIAGPKLLYRQTEEIQHCGTVINEKGDGWHLDRHLPGDADTANRPRCFRAITGACLIIERGLFLRLGGFDIRYHQTGGCEDTDLCFKVLEAGLLVAYCPGSTVYHDEGESRGSRDAFHPEEVYNRKLLRQRWEKYLKPDIADYQLLAEIEAAENCSWRWLREVPAEILAPHCARLFRERERLAAERDHLAAARAALEAERDALVRRQGDTLVTLAHERRQRNLLAAGLRRQLEEAAGAAGRAEYRASQREAAAAVEIGRVAQARDALAAERRRAVQQRDRVAAALLLETRRSDALAAELWRQTEAGEVESACKGDQIAEAAERDGLRRERDALAAALLVAETRLRESARPRPQGRFSRWFGRRPVVDGETRFSL